MDPNPAIAAQLTPFNVDAEMHDGTTRRLIVYGFGSTYLERLTDAREQTRHMPELKGAKVIHLR